MSDQSHGLRQAVKPRVRGLAPWSPQQATLELLAQVEAVLEEYAEYLPLTIRQIFYRLVGAYGYPKQETAYDRLCEVLNRARRAELVPFSAIRDDSADIQVSMDWDDVAEFLRGWHWEVENFRLDRQQGQPRRLVFMVEAAGMRPQIETAVEDYSIRVIPSGGFDSLTAKYDLAEALGDLDGVTEILHIGDHDPSGAHLFLSMAEDVQALMRDLGRPGEAEFTRLAVTPMQIAGLRLPTAPPKATDRRAFVGETVQAEAIPPDVLANIVRLAVEERLDQPSRIQTLRREDRLKKWLAEQLRYIDPSRAPQR
jgi:hypothetical protein